MPESELLVLVVGGNHHTIAGETLDDRVSFVNEFLLHREHSGGGLNVRIIRRARPIDRISEFRVQEVGTTPMSRSIREAIIYVLGSSH